MSSDNWFSFPNPMNYSAPSNPNSMDSSNPALTNSEENHPQPFSKTELPMFNLGASNGMSDVGQSGGSNDGQPSGSGPDQMTSIMKSIVLEIPPGSEVVEWLKLYAHSRNIILNVLGGFGVFSEATISHISSEDPTIFSEKLYMISFTGTAGEVSPSELSVFSSFTASFSRMDGVIIGGTLRRLVTSGPMTVTALISNSPPEFIGFGYQTFA